MLYMQRDRQAATLRWLAATGVPGAAFIGLELYEFAVLLHEGAGPQVSAFLSACFTLVMGASAATRSACCCPWS
nr:hypothetical protein [Massilia niastensis]